MVAPLVGPDGRIWKLWSFPSSLTLASFVCSVSANRWLRSDASLWLLFAFPLVRDDTEHLIMGLWAI